MPAIATEPWCIERLDSFRCFLAARGRQATTTRGTRSSGIIEQQTNAPLIAEPTTRRSESRASERATAKQSETTGVQQKKRAMCTGNKQARRRETRAHRRVVYQAACKVKNQGRHASLKQRVPEALPPHTQSILPISMAQAWACAREQAPSV